MKFIMNILFILVILLLLSWKITLAVLPLLLLILLFTIYYQRHVESIATNNRNFNYHQSGYLRELTKKYKTLLCFGNFEYEKSYYKTLIKENYLANTNITLLKYFLTSLTNPLIYVSNAIVIIFGAYLIKENLENNVYAVTSGGNNIFNFGSGQVLSFILLLFYLKFYCQEIFVSLKEISETCKGVENYYKLKQTDDNRYSNSKSLKIHLAEDKHPDLADLPRQTKKNFINQNFKIKEINFIDVAFDYKDIENEENKLKINEAKLMENQKDANVNYKNEKDFLFPKYSDELNINVKNENIKKQDVSVIKDTKRNIDQSNLNIKVDDMFGANSPLKKYSFNLNLDKLKILLSPSKRPKALKTEKLNLEDFKLNDNYDNEVIGREHDKSLNIKDINNKKETFSPLRKVKKGNIGTENKADEPNVITLYNIKENPKNINHEMDLNAKEEEKNEVVSSRNFESPKKKRKLNNGIRTPNKEKKYSSNSEFENCDLNKSQENKTENQANDLDFMVNLNDNFNKKKLEIKNLNLCFETEKLNYLIGKSGSGKTTILSLILCLFKPSLGKILINNTIDINSIDENEYSGFIGYVPQESIFYDLSVKENIRFFQDNISDEKINEIVKFLKMDRFIDKLKIGMDTKIGPNGSTLSGGQRQLISIARALVKDPRILLLDEFTSNFDNILTEEIFSLLEKLCSNTIVIVVTHNLKIIDVNNAKNKLIFLEDGKIKEKTFLSLRKNYNCRKEYESNGFFSNEMSCNSQDIKYENSFKLNENPEENSITSKKNEEDNVKNNGLEVFKIKIDSYSINHERRIFPILNFYKNEYMNSAKNYEKNKDVVAVKKDNGLHGDYLIGISIYYVFSIQYDAKGTQH